ncbi:endonuclease/exonuclease/phosphatase family protein [Roseovarius aestuarii]|uniref:Endonuclease/exonuclease/phosphatase domain-containing protein n=1 Tax=Roseovarius aestuarii TaxID=475083 RepID=A0A1X7BS19_9RHOB|nr:endonuclease/exonuclease/phosphatase family protein [Roseovarius aestuarii]SMC12397.1 hypothetical protein ROA7745_02222 [Roseovarius aestuarii]
MDEVLKYGLLLIGNLIAFSGAWLVSFTEIDKVTKRKRLTKWGRRALPLAIILLVAGFALTILNDRQGAQKALEAQRAAEQRNLKITRLLSESEARDDQMAALLTQLLTQVADASAEPDATLVSNLADSQVVSQLAADDPELAAALNQLEERLGGRGATIERMSQRGVALPAATDDVLIAMHLGLRWFGGNPFRDAEEEIDPITVTALQSIIRGVNADVIAVTEISDVSSFEILIDRLPQYRVVYGERGLGGRMGTAMLYRPDRVRLARQPGTIYGENYRFPRPPQVLSFEFTGQKFQTVLVHLRSQRASDEDPRGSVRREMEVQELLVALDDRPPMPTLILGVLNAPNQWPEFERFREVDARFAGNDLPADATTFISERFGPMVLSDFAALGGLQDKYLDQSIEVISLPDWLGPSWTSEQITERISDHHPIVAAFDFGNLAEP